ncbi:hypothetical protein AB5J62_15230 [Amycolatopsis sp. cg5]|uniref:hypothetical protein n=1 Tax=Amycolatopsis sp. cg5 TaxID=3238802 RepID=UPI00352476C6
MGRVYDHVTPAMRQHVIASLEARWAASLIMLRPTEREKLASWFPHLKVVYRNLEIEPVKKIHAGSTPRKIKTPSLARRHGALTCENVWCAILGLNQ